jgi:hypothetical protein
MRLAKTGLKRRKHTVVIQKLDNLIKKQLFNDLGEHRQNANRAEV